MKTVQNYLNDSRIINDPDMKDALELVKELHAIRLKIQDETDGMNAAEEAAYHRRKTEELFNSFGLSLPQYADFSGHRNLKRKELALT